MTIAARKKYGKIFKSFPIFSPEILCTWEIAFVSEPQLSGQSEGNIQTDRGEEKQAISPLIFPIHPKIFYTLKLVNFLLTEIEQVVEGEYSPLLLPGSFRRTRVITFFFPHVVAYPRLIRKNLLLFRLE